AYVSTTTLQTTQKLDANNNTLSSTYLDSLGRVHKTALTSDPEGTVYTRTDYDASGRKQKQWNPTRCDPDVSPNSCSGESTFGFTQYQYDPLNRTTLVTEQ